MSSMSSAAAKVKTTRTHKPATLLSCHCISRPAYGTSHEAGAPGYVEINGTTYTLVCLGATSRDGYRLTNHDNGKVYDIETSSGFPACDCGDSTFRRGITKGDYCKHGQAAILLRKDRVI